MMPTALPHWDVSLRCIYSGFMGPHVPTFMYHHGRGILLVRMHRVGSTGGGCGHEQTDAKGHSQSGC